MKTNFPCNTPDEETWFVIGSILIFAHSNNHTNSEFLVHDFIAIGQREES
jgi:hypothetical protein